MSADDAPTPPDDLESLLALAAAHDLDLEGSTLRTEEVGLDFRVAIARARDGQDWVLRIPRRPDVLDRADVEGRLLATVAPQLEVAVPDWRISTSALIAYPLLPGEPALSVAAGGEVTWHLDISSRTYAESLGAVIAQLHEIDRDDAAASGIEVRTPAEVRTAWSRDLERVAEAFEISAPLRERWDAWIAEDSYWPQHSVLTHGEIYPGHTLVKGERITGILDWTTAAIGDPAKDLMFHQVSAPPEVFDIAVVAYTAGGGRPWPRFAEHCAEMFSAGPIGYGLFALETGAAEHREAAAAVLNPPDAT